MDEHAIRDYLSELSREQLEKLVVSMADATQYCEVLTFHPPVQYLDGWEKEWAETGKYSPGFTHFGEPLI